MDSVDFLPERIRTQRVRRRRLALHACLLALCAAALGGLGYAFQGRIRSARAELALVAGRGDNVSQQIALRGTLEAQMADLMVKKEIEETLGRRVGILEVLAELQRVLPESMALTNLTLETVEVQMPVEPAKAGASGRAVARGKAASRSVKRVRVLLTGLAPTNVDVANFIGQLSGGRMFEDVNMGYARDVTFRARSARQFQVSCLVVR